MNVLKINTELIDRELVHYFETNDGESPYLICNLNTSKLITSQCLSAGLNTVNVKECCDSKDMDVVERYKGVKVLIDNSLELGELILR